MNPYLIIAFLAAVLCAGAGGFKLGADHELASQAREDKHIAEAIEAGAHASAEAIAQIKVTNTTIRGKVIREIQTRTVYTECKHSGDGLRLINSALTGASAPGDSKLPKPEPVK